MVFPVIFAIMMSLTFSTVVDDRIVVLSAVVDDVVEAVETVEDAVIVATVVESP